MRAVISLGTNTARLLVIRDGPEGAVEQLEAAAVGTRLGEGLRDGGALTPAAVERTLAAVSGFMQRVRAHGARPAAIATSAMRRTDDAREFGRRMRAVTGVELQILDGVREAEASFFGATYGAADSGARIAVVDVGGGSTECATGTARALEAAHSIEIGSVRIAEQFPDFLGASPGDRAQAAAAAARLEIAARLAPLRQLGPVGEVRCVAGTPLTIAAVAAESHVERMSGTILTLATLEATVDRLLDLGLEARRVLPGMVAQRADILPAGGLIVAEALRALGASEARLEENDLLLGFLLRNP